MIEIVCSSMDVASSNAARSIISSSALRESQDGTYKNGEIELRLVGGSLLKTESLDALNADLIIFISRHSSASGIPALTVHSLGNWSEEARFGGDPHTLSTASPLAMLKILKELSRLDINIEKTYEATHHGPLLNTPSLFAEFGGNEKTIADKTIAGILGNAVYRCAEELASNLFGPSKVVIGIGGNHYPSKFTKLALDKDYAFSHILPKYAISEESIGLLEQAALKSQQRPEAAAIDWKSLNADLRSMIIKKLDGMGMDYERI